MEVLLEIPPAYLLAAFLVTATAAAVQGTIGLGFSIFSVPVLSLIDPRLAPVPQLMLAMPLTLSMAYRERHALELKPMIWVFVGRIPGLVGGVLLLGVASQRLLDVIIGAVVLVAVLVLSTSLSVRRTAVTEFLAGAASGTSGLVSSIGGPPLALLYRDDKGEAIRANLAMIFAVGLFMSLGGRAYAGKVQWVEVLVAVSMMPALGLGLVASGRLLGKIEGPILRRAVLVVCSLAALALLGRAVLG